MAKQFTGIGVLAILTAVGGLIGLGACGSDSSSGDCTTLPSCCAQLPAGDNKNECDAVVQTMDTDSCAEAQDAFVSDGSCTMSTSSASSGSGCVGLDACCAKLSGTEQTDCEIYVTAANDGLCTQELATYPSCAVSTSTTATGCAGLTECCGTLSGTAATDCAEEVTLAAGSDATCGTFLMALTSEGMCSGTSTGTGTGTGTGTSGTGCAGLSDCCASMSGEAQTVCNEEVTASAGVDSTCTDYLTELQDEDMCGGSTTTVPDAGTSSGGGCSALSSCCSSVSDATEQEECNSVVTEGNDTTCSDTLTEYMSASLCN